MSKPYVWVMTTEYAPFIIGGLGAVATKLSKALMQLKVDLSIIAQSPNRTLQIHNQIIRIPEVSPYFNFNARSYNPAAVEQLTRRNIQRKPDAIHIHSLEFAQAALSFKKRYGIPVIYTCHSLISMESRMHIARSNVQLSLIRQADKIVVPSIWLMNEMKKRYLVNASKLSVIPHGVSAVSKRSKASPSKLLFVGRLLRSKGIEPLIQSISLLSARNKQVQLSIVGKGSSGYRGRLQSMASRLGISSRIRFLGALPHGSVERLYSSYGAVVVPSEQESFCLVALEAMANGVPLVSTRAGGLKEFVNSSNAVIIPVVEARTIARAVEELWRNPQQTRSRVMNGRLVAQRYNWRKMAARYRSLFLSVQK